MSVPILPAFRFTLKNGKATFMDWDRRVSYIKSLPDGEYQEIIRPAYEPKSRDLERYYHPVVVALWAEHQGYSRKEAHEDLLLECGERDEYGETIRTSDPRLTRKMYRAYVERCKMFLNREGCPCPEPGEYITDWGTDDSSVTQRHNIASREGGDQFARGPE